MGKCELYRDYMTLNDLKYDYDSSLVVYVYDIDDYSGKALWSGKIEDTPTSGYGNKFIEGADSVTENGVTSVFSFINLSMDITLDAREMQRIDDYFNSCVDFWVRQGFSKGVATVRALWWDCVEIWNFDESWNDEKIEFINKWRQYKPYGPVPEIDRVAEGNA